jgi:hypothetical protein
LKVYNFLTPPPPPHSMQLKRPKGRNASCIEPHPYIVQHMSTSYSNLCHHFVNILLDFVHLFCCLWWLELDRVSPRSAFKRLEMPLPYPTLPRPHCPTFGYLDQGLILEGSATTLKYSISNYTKTCNCSIRILPDIGRVYNLYPKVH